MISWLNQDATKDFGKILKFLEDQLSDVDPNDPNWSIKQSNVIGQRHMIDKVRKIMQYE